MTMFSLVYDNRTWTMIPDAAILEMRYLPSMSQEMLDVICKTFKIKPLLQLLQHTA
jgi:septum formation topological specificity factor MinE